MEQSKLYKTSASWSRLGGIAGIVIVFLLFGFGDEGGARGLLLSGLRGFVGAALGAGILYGFARLVFDPNLISKITFLILIAIFSAVAVFLLYKFSPKFNELVGKEIVELVEIDSPSTVQPSKPYYPKYIVVIVSPNGQDLSMGTNSIHGLGRGDELVNSVKKISDQDPEFFVLILPVNLQEDETTRAINKFKAAGIENVRKISREDRLMMEEEENRRRQGG